MPRVEFEFELEIPSVDITPLPIRPSDGSVLAKYHTGPYFYGWLPDESDAIRLPTDDSQVTLWVWYEGWSGEVPDGRSVDYEESVPPPMIREGGNLHGELYMDDVADDVIMALQRITLRNSTNGHRGHDDAGRYRELAIRIRDIMFDPITTFIDLLRYQFGQYWIAPLPRNLGSSKDPSLFFSQFIEFSWSIDEFETQFDFDPPIHSRRPTIPDSVLGELPELLNKEDWDVLRELLSSERISDIPTVGLDHKSFSRARQARDRGDLQSAYVEAVTALDVALAPHRRDREDYESYPKYRPKLAVETERLLPQAFPRFPEQAENAIRTRNKIVHDGFTVNPNYVVEIDSLLNVVWELLTPSPKRPSAAITAFRASAFIEPGIDTTEHSCPSCGYTWRYRPQG